MTSQAEASEDEVYTEDISRVAPVPPSPLSKTCLPTLDSQTTLDIAQVVGSGIASAGAVVAIAAGAQISKEFIHGDTSSTKVTRQQMKWESEELTAGREVYKVEEHATYSYVTHLQPDNLMLLH